MYTAKYGSTISACGSRHTHSEHSSPALLYALLTWRLRRDDVLAGLSHAIRTLRIEKSLIGWDLEELERLTQGEDERSPDSDDESESEVERMLPAQL